jgi:hypothetical protein
LEKTSLDLGRGVKNKWGLCLVLLDLRWLFVGGDGGAAAVGRPPPSSPVKVGHERETEGEVAEQLEVERVRTRL